MLNCWSFGNQYASGRDSVKLQKFIPFSCIGTSQDEAPEPITNFWYIWFCGNQLVSRGSRE